MNKNTAPFMRQAVMDLEESRIREVANAGMGRPDVLAFWFGESDEVTPDIVRQAATDSLQKGETFYSHNLGLPELRQAVSDYMSALHGPVGVDRLAITSGGVNALMLAAQALIDAGDEVVAVTPVWPNLTAQALVMGANLKCVSLRPVDGQWQLDMAALKAAITPATRMLIVNSPNNPTGWTLSRAEQAEILAHCRSTGTWVLADEVYERLYYETDTANGCAPSFLDVSQPDDRLVVVHSFSKSFFMTGWRLGWLVLPPGHLDAIGAQHDLEHALGRLQRRSQIGRATVDGQHDAVVVADALHELAARALGEQAAGVEDADAVAEPLGLLHVVGGVEHAGACRRLGAHLVEQVGPGLWVDADRRLVEQPQHARHQHEQYQH